MCDPISAILSLALGAGASLLGQQKTKSPPPAVPAPSAPVAADTQPVIKVNPDDTKDDVSAKGGNAFVATRKAGTSIGGLGRSDLTLNL